MASDPNPKQRVMPTLRMTAYERSKAFYVGRLGFQIDWEHRFEPGFPVFMQVSRDGMAFFLTEHTGDCPVGGLVHLYVPDVDGWFSEFRDKGVAVQEPPDEYLQGLRSMTIQDPDGNKLHICTRLPVWQRQTEEVTSGSTDPEGITPGPTASS
jgi:catechol 2,3-dioxygenase-like lactoylglutathione lyase family enzyme